MRDQSDEPVTLLCARITTPLYIADNRIGRCAECGWKVQYRPHAPKGRKICMECAIDLVPGDTNVRTTPEMLADFQSHLAKKRQ